jgi:predicted nucleotide-binding protein (sugar kinase/HSP70/actin superfamily)
MGPLSTDILRASFEGIGIRSTALPLYEFDELKRGREYSSCKECLPLQLVVGGLLRYLEEREDQEELLAYFMPFTPGNCRFAQYRVFINNLIEKQQIRNVSLFSLNAWKISITL